MVSSTNVVHSYDAIKYNLLQFKIFGVFPPIDLYRKKIYYCIQGPIHSILTFFFYYGFYYYAFTQPVDKAAEAMSSALLLTNVVIKGLMILYYQKSMVQTFEMMKELDELTKDEDEKDIMRKTIKKCHTLEMIVHSIIFLMILAKIVAVFINFNGERVPLFPIWVPYDWVTDSWIYIGTMIYQFVAIELQVIGYTATQLFAPLILCMIIGHVEVLLLRAEKIGSDRQKSLEENHKDLIQFAKTFNLAYRVFEVYASVIELQMITQFLLSALILSTQIVLTIYFPQTLAASIYSGLYVINIIFNELFLSCWYGEKLKVKSDEFTLAYFKMNWIDQSRKFKKDLLMLMQRSQRGFQMQSGIMHINLTSFTLIVRFAYSASLILGNMKDTSEK